MVNGPPGEASGDRERTEKIAIVERQASLEIIENIRIPKLPENFQALTFRAEKSTILIAENKYSYRFSVYTFRLRVFAPAQLFDSIV